jgi:hypothetical protein
VSAIPSLETSVSTTFDVLSWEIELAGARCIFLDALIGELMPTVPPERRERLMQGMQAVDLLAQHLTSLSAFARRLSEDAPDGAVLSVDPALSDITLGDLVSRMRSALGGGPEPEPEPAESGALDLF